MTRRNEQRSDYIPTERKARRDMETRGKRLSVRTDLLDFNQFKYRWINENEARIHQMTQRDWQLVQKDGTGLREEEKDPDLGNLYSTIVGTTPEGRGLRAYLCRKLCKWWEEDQKQKQTELDEQLEQLRRGMDRDGEAQSDYVPRDAIKVAG